MKKFWPKGVEAKAENQAPQLAGKQSNVYKAIQNTCREDFDKKGPLKSVFWTF